MTSGAGYPLRWSPVTNHDIDRSARRNASTGLEVRRGRLPGPYPGTSRDAPPALAEGLQQLGAYAGHGSSEPRYLLKRADGRVIPVSHLLHRLIAQIDGRRPMHQIAAALSSSGQRPMSAANVAYLIKHKLRPLGVMRDSSPSGRRRSLLLGIATKKCVIPQRAVERVARWLSPAFHAVPVVAVVVGTVAMELWLFSSGAFSFDIDSFLQNPNELLVVVGVTLLASIFHELGHAAATHYGGATPGPIGVGVHLVWPAFYTDITDSYRLSRTGRLRADLGGIYFNLISMLVLATLHLHSGWSVWIPAILVQHLLVLQQFVPFLRLDGYYVVSDLIGVPDLFGHLGAALRGLNPWSRNPVRASELRRGVRIGLAVWSLTTVAVLSAAGVLLLAGLPGLAAEALRMLRSEGSVMADALRSGQLAAAAAATAHIVILAVQKFGLGMVGARAAVVLIARPAARAVSARRRGRPGYGASQA